MSDGIYKSAEIRRKFDIQLKAAEINEQKLLEILRHTSLDFSLELKSESFQWEQTGNIAIEYKWNGQPSGLAATEAQYWVHELKRDGETLVYLWWPIEHLKKICRENYSSGKHRDNAGDEGRSSVVLLKLTDLFRPARGSR